MLMVLGIPGGGQAVVETGDGGCLCLRLETEEGGSQTCEDSISVDASIGGCGGCPVLRRMGCSKRKPVQASRGSSIAAVLSLRHSTPP